MGTCGLSRLTRLSYLDAGSAIHFATPQGPITLVPAPGLPPFAYYGGQFGRALSAGDYALDNGDGGRDLGPFRATFSLPEIGFSWTNQDSLSIRPDEGLRITWDGGITGGYVVISGAFSIEGYEGGTDIQGGFSCVEHVEKGNFFVPAADMWTSLTRAADYLLEVEVIHVYKQMIDVSGLDLTDFFYNLGAYKAVKLR
jgi:hypothetical protein